jgi:hypothetical protein
MNPSWPRDAFCTLLLMLALWNSVQEIFNLNGEGWQQASLIVTLEK